MVVVTAAAACGGWRQAAVERLLTNTPTRTLIPQEGLGLVEHRLTNDHDEDICSDPMDTSSEQTVQVPLSHSATATREFNNDGLLKVTVQNREARIIDSKAGFYE